MVMPGISDMEHSLSTPDGTTGTRLRCCELATYMKLVPSRVLGEHSRIIQRAESAIGEHSLLKRRVFHIELHHSISLSHT